LGVCPSTGGARRATAEHRHGRPTSIVKVLYVRRATSNSPPGMASVRSVASWARSRPRSIRTWLLAHRAALGVLLGAGAVAAIVVVVRLAPQWLASTEGLTAKERAEEIGRTRTGLLAVLAGTIAVIGAYYTARTFALNREGQITERFTRAVDQLGHKEVDVRLGGIYGLERLARESRDDFGPIVEILTAYVREHAPRRSTPSPVDETPDTAAQPNRDLGALPRLATDVQAVMSVLARLVRPPVADPVRLDFQHTDLQHLRLSGPASNLERASFFGANLRRASFLYANLRNATFYDANLVDAHLLGANLQGARLISADLRGAILHRVDLQDADLGMADLRGADLRRANLEGAKLAGANLDGARYNADTKWPDGFDPKGTGANEVDT
jgi:uncharacterized protein YjbI with pentapeptide repeats